MAYKTNIYCQDFEKGFQNALNKVKGKNKQVLAEYFKAREFEIRAIRKRRILTNIVMFIKSQKIKDLSKVEEEQVRAFFRECEARNLSEATLKTYKEVLAGLFKHIHKMDESKDLPPEMKFLTKRKFKQVKKQGALLVEADIRLLHDKALTLRDKAFISLLWFSGARVGELLTLRREDVEPLDINKRTFRVKITESKTTPREVAVEDKFLALSNYLDNANLEPTQFIFTTKKGSISYEAFVKVIRECAKRAGLAKKVNPHWFRHSRASFLAEKGINAGLLNPYMGWGHGSTMAGVYLHNTSKSADSFITSLATQSSEHFIQKMATPETADNLEKQGLVKQVAEMLVRDYGDYIVSKIIEEMTHLKSVENKLEILTKNGSALAGIEAKEFKSLKTRKGRRSNGRD